MIFVGLFAGVDSAIVYVGVGALLHLRRRVRVRPALRRAAWRSSSARRSPRSRASREPRARERGAQPAAHRDHGAPLMIGVALVGFITIFAASAKASIATRSTTSSRPTTSSTDGTGFDRAQDFSPTARRRDRRRCRRSSTRRGVRVRLGRHQRASRCRSSRVRSGVAASSSSTSTASAATFSDSDERRHRDFEAQGRRATTGSSATRSR